MSRCTASRVEGPRFRSLVGTAVWLVWTSGGLVVGAGPVPRPGWPVTSSEYCYGSLGREAIYFSDVDGDGRNELVDLWFCASYPSKIARVEVWRGDGTMMLAIPFVEPSLMPNCAPLVIDLDDDGELEFVLGTRGIGAFDSDGSVRWLWNRNFADPILKNLTVTGLAAAELDGDGEPWILATTEPGVLFAFDRDGNFREGWPLVLPNGSYPWGGPPISSASYVSPTVVDIDGDGRPEIVIGTGDGRLLCHHADKTPCSGFPIVTWADYWYAPRLDVEPITAWREISGRTLFTAASYLSTLGCEDRPDKLVYVFDDLGQVVAPFPRPLDGPTLGYSMYDASPCEINGETWLAVGGDDRHYLFRVSDGSLHPGWPISAETGSFMPPLCGALGGGSTDEILFGGNSWSGAMVRAIRSTGQTLPGWPLSSWHPQGVRGGTLGTFDGVETTLCWTGDDDSGETIVHCHDLGIPWSRSNVQYGQWAFDLDHTSRFRRLWQIDRSATAVRASAPEVATLPGESVTVSVCPKQPGGALLGDDQRIRFARKPKLGKFAEAVSYDPASGCSSRMFLPPDQDEGADVEIRAWVNDELDDDRFILHLRGRPRILGRTPAAVARGPMTTDVTLTGTDFSSAPTVEASTGALSVVRSVPTGKDKVVATVRAPLSSPIGWSGLEVVSADGRRSTPVPIFVFDPAEVTLLVSEGSSGRVDLEWWGGAPLGSAWQVDRSTSPSFATGSVVYRGPARNWSDSAPAGETWLYRVK